MLFSSYKTETITFKRLFDNGVFYSVPKFQADYRCSLQMLDDLWTDAISSIESDEKCYLGLLLLKDKDEKNFDVLFDQHKLTALTLMVLAVIQNLKKLVDNQEEPDQNLVRMNQIWHSFISNLDPVTLKECYKLTLNNHDNEYFKNKLVFEVRDHGKLTKIDNLMYKSFLWFDNKVSALLQVVESDKGKFLAKFVENFSENLFFTVITISDDNEAYKVLDALNTTKINIATADLLKNHLLSEVENQKCNSNELIVLQKKWNFMVNRLQDDNLLDFIRVYWNSKYSYVSHSDFFSKIKSDINNISVVNTLIDGLLSELDNYLDLLHPDNSHYDDRVKSNLNILKKLKVTQAYSLLLCAKRKLSEKEFSSLLTAVVSVSFSFDSFCLDSLSEFEKDCGFIVSKLNSEKKFKLDEAKYYLLEKYPSHDNL